MIKLNLLSNTLMTYKSKIIKKKKIFQKVNPQLSYNSKNMIQIWLFKIKVNRSNILEPYNIIVGLFFPHSLKISNFKEINKKALIKTLSLLPLFKSKQTRIII
jgi:hypothetical protein